MHTSTHVGACSTWSVRVGAVQQQQQRTDNGRPLIFQKRRPPADVTVSVCVWMEDGV